MRGGNDEEIIQQVQNVIDMQFLLGNPFYGRRKNFKRFARAWTTHRHTAIIIIKSSPTNPQKVVILRLNRNDSKSILNICFGHKTAVANSSDGMNGIFNRSVGYASKFWRNAIIQRRTLRKRKVVNQTEFTLCLFRNQTKWRYTKMGKGWRGIRARNAMSGNFFI